MHREVLGLHGLSGPCPWGCTTLVSYRFWAPGWRNFDSFPWEQLESSVHAPWAQTVPGLAPVLPHPGLYYTPKHPSATSEQQAVSGMTQPSHYLKYFVRKGPAPTITMARGSRGVWCQGDPGQVVFGVLICSGGCCPPANRNVWPQ